MNAQVPLLFLVIETNAFIFNYGREPGEEHQTQRKASIRFFLLNEH